MDARKLLLLVAAGGLPRSSRLLAVLSSVIVCIAAGLVGPAIGRADLPSVAWSVPIERNDTAFVAPNGNLLTSNCEYVTRDGSVVWHLPLVKGYAPTCMDGISDSEGNLYVLTEEASGNPVIESISAAGSVRWGTPTGGFVSWRTGPVLGANGSVFFSMWNGAYSKVVGYNEQTGAMTFEQSFSDVTGLHAYTGGIIVVETDSLVYYLNYSGEELTNYTTGAPISAYEAYSNSAGADGTVFVAGYDGGCEHASVEKITPSGIAWTWTDKEAYCSQTNLAATPDGGVIFANSESNASAVFTSLSATGSERWTDHAKGPIGPAQDGGSFPVHVDVNGVVALPAFMIYRCSVQPSEGCLGAQVEFRSAQTGSMMFPPIEADGYGEYGFTMFGTALDSERLYMAGEVEEPTVAPTVSAYTVPGLGKDYQLGLQEALTTTGSPQSPSSGGANTNGTGGAQPVSGAPPQEGGGSSSPSLPVISACKPVHGSLLKRVLAGLKCKAAEAVLDAKCAAGVALLVAFPLKLLKVIEVAKSAEVLAKIPKALYPAAETFYDIAHYKVLPKAPAGYRSVSEIVAKIKDAKNALADVEILPDLVRAFLRSNVSQIAYDFNSILGLHACVQVAANAGAP